MILALALLLGCQLAGEIAARGLGLAVPGPVIGLIVLLAGILVYARGGTEQDGIDDTAVGRTSNGLLQNLSLLFVPAGAGVIQHTGLLGEHFFALAVALIGSAAITLVVTVFIFRAVQRLQSPGDEGAPP